MELYYYIHQGTNPYENLALEELLFESLGEDEVILYLWQNDNTVVIGRNQNPWRECRLEAFTAQSGRLARRLSGGGAVFHDLGNQNFTFLAPNSHYNVSRQLEVIQKAVSLFGMTAENSGRNDILVNGRKFSGNAFHKTAKAAFHHGTILINSDMARLGEFLAPSPEKLQAKGVESVRARVINLQEESPAVTPAAMRAALVDAASRVYHQTPQPLPTERIDRPRWQALTEKYESDQWRLGRLSQFSYELRHRFDFGELELLLSVENGLVQEAKVYSDAMDAGWVQVLEQSLKGKPFTAAGLSRAVPRAQDAPTISQQVAAYLAERV